MPDIDLSRFLHLSTIVKGGVITLVIMYTFFALILVRQIQLMTKVVEVPIASILKAIVYLHFALTLLLLVLTFTIL